MRSFRLENNRPVHYRSSYLQQDLLPLLELPKVTVATSASGLAPHERVSNAISAPPANAPSTPSPVLAEVSNTDIPDSSAQHQGPPRDSPNLLSSSVEMTLLSVRST